MTDGIETDAQSAALPTQATPWSPDSSVAATPAIGWSAYFRQTARRFAIYFLIYCLSLGPMYWPWYRGKFLNGSQTVALFYEPLYRLAAFRPIADALNWYVELWVA